MYIHIARVPKFGHKIETRMSSPGVLLLILYKFFLIRQLGSLFHSWTLLFFNTWDLFHLKVILIVCDPLLWWRGRGYNVSQSWLCEPHRRHANICLSLHTSVPTHHDLGNGGSRVLLSGRPTGVTVKNSPLIVMSDDLLYLLTHTETPAGLHLVKDSVLKCSQTELYKYWIVQNSLNFLIPT